ncbi:hypothetical protein [Saccharopolyspora rectivirgula]|mgnify:CR=1 FL=1|jgi:hypothetical protein|uniref:Uncharacterized protein n=1 Tax=Saccharopolyspora rectivirgula TaxID=28042 RepID=A0A073AX78_9PSEU|nr:hypothetical protein [Saccharopolyspora rectivirgula]KEI44005.1 hypothetical protein GU90_13690 [Saccharopolyspora rectivirgula]MCC5698140.1 hypothetical protein [Klebsiella pneumoniae]
MTDKDTLMWEARAQPGKLDQLLAWIDSTALPHLRKQPQFRSADVFRSAEDRAVVVIRFTGQLAPLPQPPAELLRREVHQWPFRYLGSA